MENDSELHWLKWGEREWELIFKWLNYIKCNILKSNDIIKIYPKLEEYISNLSLSMSTSFFVSVLMEKLTKVLFETFFLEKVISNKFEVSLKKKKKKLKFIS